MFGSVLDAPTGYPHRAVREDHAEEDQGHRATIAAGSEPPIASLASPKSI